MNNLWRFRVGQRVIICNRSQGEEILRGTIVAQPRTGRGGYCVQVDGVKGTWENIGEQSLRQDFPDSRVEKETTLTENQ